MSFFVLWGFILWLCGALIFRVTGQFFLNPADQFLLILIFIATIPLIAVATYPVYESKKICFSERPLAAILIALPGMLLDIFSVLFFRSVFPNLLPAAITYFSVTLLWGYSLILLTGFDLNQKKSGKRNA